MLVYTVGMFEQKYMRLFSVIVFAISFFVFASPAHATGVSPSTIDAGRLFKRATFSGEFRISDSNTDAHRYYAISKEGVGSKYVELSSDRLTIARGTSNAPVKVRINPDTAPNGRYIVLIAVTPVRQGDGGASSQGQSVDAESGVVGRLIFEVTGEEIHSFSIDDFFVPHAEENQLVQIGFNVDNEGTVDFRFDTVVVQVLDNDTDELVATSTIQKMGVVGAGSRADLSMLTDIELEPGHYTIKAQTVHASGQKKQYVAPLSVYSDGTLSQKADVRDVRVSSPRAKKGKKVKIEVGVENTGESSFAPSATLSFYKGKKKVDEFKVSKDESFAPGDVTIFTTLFTPNSRGQYTVLVTTPFGVDGRDRGHVRFNVGGRIYLFFLPVIRFFDDPLISMKVLGVIGFIVLILFGTYVLTRRKKTSVDLPSDQTAVKGPSMKSVLPDVPTIDVVPDDTSHIEDQGI